ncbi:DUF2530 domain-containing protein [Streptomyces sp. NPDC054784]
MGLISKWTDGGRVAPEPLEGDVVRTVRIGTAVWCVLLVAQLPFYGWISDHGHTWWLGTCAVGIALGLFGLWYVVRRERALAASAAAGDAAEGSAAAPGAEPGDGPA